MEAEEGGERNGARRSRVHATRDRVVSELPQIDPGLKELFMDMIPGRAILRVLTNPPEEVITHTRNARRERLLALRSLIDGLIDEADRPAARSKAREVEIE